MTKAFAYLRVSSRGQIDGDGFDRQLLACQKYAAANGLEIETVFREEGICGGSELENRPALQELYLALNDGGTKVILIEKLDRLARDLMIQETMIADFKKHGFELVSASEPDLCSEEPSRILMRQIFGAVAQYDRAMIVLKLRGARERKKSKIGRCEGRKPFGDRPEESKALGLIHHFHARRAGTQWIADYLNQNHIPTRYGKKWNAGTIWKILYRHKQITQSSQEVA